MKKKKLKSILNFNKSTISKLGNMQIGAGHTGPTLSQIPDAQSECLCGPPATIFENTCGQESHCVGSCYYHCTLDEGTPPDNF